MMQVPGQFRNKMPVACMQPFLPSIMIIQRIPPSELHLEPTTMRSFRLLMSFCPIAAIVLSAAVHAQEKPLNTPPPGFTALFNGKDLTGWKGLPLKAQCERKEEGRGRSSR